MSIILNDSIMHHVYRRTYITSILCEEFPVPGVDQELALQMSLIYSCSSAPTTPHFKAVHTLLDSRLIEVEIVEIADYFDILLMAHTRKFLRDPLITKKYNKVSTYFTERKAKIQQYYPYIDKMLGAIIYGWSNDFFESDLSIKDLEERATFGLHIV